MRRRQSILKSQQQQRQSNPARQQALKQMMGSLPPELRASAAEIDAAARLPDSFDVGAAIARTAPPRNRRRILGARPAPDATRSRAAAARAAAPKRPSSAEVIAALPSTLHNTAPEICAINERVYRLDVDRLVRGGGSFLAEPSRAPAVVDGAARVIASSSSVQLARPFTPQSPHGPLATPARASCDSLSSLDTAIVSPGVPPPSAFFLSAPNTPGGRRRAAS